MMKRFFGKCAVLMTLAFISSVPSLATHLRAGEITLVRLSCSSYSYQIILHVYTKNSSDVKFGMGTLSFGDGTPDLLLPKIDENDPEHRFKLLDAYSDVGQVTFTTTHTFPGLGVYTISYFERNRNTGILNLTNSVETPFFIQTQIWIDPLIPCNDTPRLLVPPIDKGCTGVAWFHNPGAYDPNGDSLSFELYTPKQDRDVDVAGYALPDSKKFYDAAGIPYNQANELGTGPPKFSINSVTGTITWDAPGEAGEYNIAFLIREWRKVFGTWIPIGYVERDMQIVIEDCNNERPELIVPADICVEAGKLINLSIKAFDPDGAPDDSIKIEAFSEVFSIDPSPATYTPGPSVWQPSFTPSTLDSINFKWQTDCRHVKDQSYIVVFKVTDNGDRRAPRLASFKTLQIRIIAPKPEWGTATVRPDNRSSVLTWQPYSCTNASTIEVWRRVDSNPYSPPECFTGIPDELGYSKVGQVPANTTTFIDKSLAAGAKYCYRLVAVFPNPPGGVSVVSDEICLPPLVLDAPVITNVTVDKTDEHAGQITVKWRSPIIFPKPRLYKVFRYEGSSATGVSKQVFPGKIEDSTAVDNGLNTSLLSYSYKVYYYKTNTDSVESAPASSVRLELKPKFKEMELNWSANVPWSNNSVDLKYPNHLIYRGLNNGTIISDLVLIDSVDVTKNQMVYVDKGQWDGIPLDNTLTYCYAVMTRGTYGYGDTLKIPSPLINFSEITCSKPNDSIPPCKPAFAVNLMGVDCKKAGCVAPGTTFSNVLIWKRPTDPNCRADIRSYTIYSASFSGQPFTKLIEGVVDTFYVHSNLPSYAQCYRITAVDGAGNESEMSDSYCFDNCPYYELPNVFTPNGDNCNDKFSAYNLKVGENNVILCNNYQLTDAELADLQRRCARFVLSVGFRVYNRWGKEVYTYQSGGEKSIYIDWDGRDNGGTDLSAGTYYYAAAVTFNVVDPNQQNKTIKGWVQIVR